jgi:hypothetical protein
MNTLLNILLLAPALVPKAKIPEEMYNNCWLAIVAFLAFLVILYLILSPDKSKKSRIRDR